MTTTTRDSIRNSIATLRAHGCKISATLGHDPSGTGHYSYSVRPLDEHQAAFLTAGLRSPVMGGQRFMAAGDALTCGLALHAMIKTYEDDDTLVAETVETVREFLSGDEGGTSDDLSGERIARLIERLWSEHRLDLFPEVAGYRLVPIEPKAEGEQTKAAPGWEEECVCDTSGTGRKADRHYVARHMLAEYDNISAAQAKEIAARVVLLLS